MGRVIFQTSMSLDGFMTASEQTPKEPLGKGGEQLHEWGFSSGPRDREYAEHAMGHGGATIVGRVTYDHSLPWCGADGPSGAERIPVFIVTHEAPAESPENGVYHFVTDGIESAVQQAKDTPASRTSWSSATPGWDGSSSRQGWSTRSRSTWCRCCSGVGRACSRTWASGTSSSSRSRSSTDRSRRTSATAS